MPVFSIANGGDLEPEDDIKAKEVVVSRSQIKKGGLSSDSCLESIKNLMAFDWSLKDIANLKTNPCKLDSSLMV
jgi:hypothetical protein